MATKKKASNGVQLSPPWYILRNKIFYLLDPDEELMVSELIEDKKGSYIIKITSENGEKLEALKKVLKESFEFGNVTVKVEFEHVRDDEITIEDYETAFAGNANFVEAVETGKGLFQGLRYIVFAKEILQFFDDDLSDLYANFNGIVADVAKEVCKKYENVYFSTDDPDAHTN